MLLINPAQEHFGGMLSRYIPVGIPVALGVLAAHMKKWGVKNIHVVDEEITSITKDNLMEHVKGLDHPKIIGLTVLTSQAGRAYEIARMYKEAIPDSYIVMGGIHVTALPEEPLATNAVDFVVRGEGEEPFRQLYFALREGTAWEHIKGLSYPKDGKIIHNPDGDLVDNLDDIPMFPYELFNHPKYDMGFITGARGCPFKCSYCSQRLLTGLTYRWHSTERVIENLRVLIEDYKQEDITFYDDNFSVNKKRVFELCDGIIKSGLHKKCAFAIQTRADCLYEEILPAMREANFQTVGLGMETGVERIAKEIEKDQTVATHLEKVALLKKYGFKVSLFMIYGFPGETAEDRDESFRIVQKADVGFSKFNNLIPYPGTAIYEVVKKTGKLHIMPGWVNFNSTLSITRSIFSTIPMPYVPEGTTAYELKRDIIKRNLMYYFQWKLIKKIMTRDKGVGWVSLPPNWFFKPREVFALTGMTFILATNLLFALLPVWIGKFFLSFVSDGDPIKPPADVKATSRSFKRVPLITPDPDQKLAPSHTQ